MSDRRAIKVRSAPVYVAFEGEVVSLVLEGEMPAGEEHAGQEGGKARTTAVYLIDGHGVRKLSDQPRQGRVALLAVAALAICLQYALIRVIGWAKSRGPVSG